MEVWRARWGELDRLAPANPFAVLIMAQLQASGHPDKAMRLAPLLRLTRKLYGYGYTREQIGQLLRLVEWVIGLPPELEAEYHLAARQLEQEHKMSYVTIAERYGMVMCSGIDPSARMARKPGAAIRQLADMLRSSVTRCCSLLP